jgi:probable phosphoglycerate mutase
VHALNNGSDGARLYLARHAQTSLNADGRLRGRLDPSLDAVGQREADELAEVLAAVHPMRVVSSPLRRAVETARVIAHRAQAPLVIDDRLIDRDYGTWAGALQADVLAQFGSLDDAPGVEPRDTVIDRALDAIDAQAEFMTSGPVVAVSHDAVNRLLLTALRPELRRSGPLRQPTACWNVLSRKGTGWLVEFVDEVA